LKPSQSSTLRFLPPWDDLCSVRQVVPIVYHSLCVEQRLTYLLRMHTMFNWTSSSRTTVTMAPSAAPSARTVEPDRPGGSQIHGLVSILFGILSRYMVFSRTRYHDVCLADKTSIYILNYFEWALPHLNAAVLQFLSDFEPLTPLSTACPLLPGLQTECTHPRKPKFPSNIQSAVFSAEQRPSLAKSEPILSIFFGLLSLPRQYLPHLRHEADQHSLITIA